MENQRSHNLPGPARRSTRVSMGVAGHSAVMHWRCHAIVGLIKAHAALVILQTVWLWNKPWNGGKLHTTSHRPNLHRDKDCDRKQLKLWLHSKIHFQWLVSELGNSDIHIMITVQLIGGKGVLETV